MTMIPRFFSSSSFLCVSVETESRDQHCSGENTPTEGDVTEKEATLSSTAEGQTMFVCQIMKYKNPKCTLQLDKLPCVLQGSVLIIL